MDFQLNIDTEKIGQLPLLDPLCVTEATSVRDVLRVLQQKQQGCVLIVENERLTGIFTERDALAMMAASQGLDGPVSEAMARNPICVERSDTVATAIERMSTGGYRQLPVVDNGRPRGLLKVKSILHYLVEHFPQVIYTLPPQPHHFPQNREGA